MTFSVAYLSQGKLYLKAPNASVREVESQFGREIQERTLRMKQNKSWKDRGLRSMMMPPGMLDQLDQQPESTVNVAIASLCPFDDKLLYALETPDMGGIFAFDSAQDREDRLFHNAEFRISHLDYAPKHQLIACATTYRTGVANIATMPIDGSRPRDITEGDSLDLAPRWVPGAGKALVFQSAGLARNSEGFVCDRSPFVIEKLDFVQQDVTTIAEDPKSDLLSPQMGADGRLYYIRRPFQSARKPFNLMQMLKDILLIPVRLGNAIFQWLSFFSWKYTGKPLMSTGTGQKVESKTIKAWGEWITPDMMRDRRFGEPDAPALVPRTWQLVRQATQGIPEVLAEGVLGYDLAEDGTIIYTNGSAIYAIAPDGQKTRLLVSNLIESVTIL
ncbi:MAG: hypothetical protein NW224_05510 [Leptolyngbyaceae cyanobacterium bins.302]|nr:hypothetical protein [Leptolyngbyaceae cyanobacterium bins.302]